MVRKYHLVANKSQLPKLASNQPNYLNFEYEVFLCKVELVPCHRDLSIECINHNTRRIQKMCLILTGR